jgi:hypothetical protein
MQATTSTAKGTTRAATARRRRRWALVIGAPVAAALIAVIAIAGHVIDEPLRQRLELTLNRKMTGYTVKLPALDFHPLGFSLTLHGLSVRQNAHPDPAVIVIEALHAGVHWRALLHLKLVADFELVSPKLHINRPQLMSEAADRVAVEDKGWQEALEAIYPLKINEFRVTDGAITYLDDDPKRPLKISRASFLATNIRNVRSPDRAYPSPIRFDAVVFDKGRLRVDGDANFLAVPHAGVRADIDVTNVPLERLRPVAIHANVYVSGGTLAVLRGAVEYAPKVQDFHLRTVQVDDATIDYVHSPQTARAEAERVEKVKEKAKELAERPILSVTIDTFSLRNATLGFVDETTTPDYRLFSATTLLNVRGFSNRKENDPVHIDLAGLFNGSGKTTLKASFLPRQRDPDLEMALQIEDADMRTMNDLFRAHGSFDVVGGQFSFYSQLQIKNGKIDGYVKPLFRDLNVYDLRQDSRKAIFQQLYEGLVGGISELLENRRDEVATQATITGEAATPELSTLEVVINLVRNAFFKAILPGLEKALREAGSAEPPPHDQ